VRGEYREHRPSEAMKPFVDCFWTRVGRPGLMSHVQECGIQMLRRPSEEGLDLASAAGYDGTLSPDGD